MYFIVSILIVMPETEIKIGESRESLHVRKNCAGPEKMGRNRPDLWRVKDK